MGMIKSKYHSFVKNHEWEFIADFLNKNDKS